MNINMGVLNMLVNNEIMREVWSAFKAGLLKTRFPEPRPAHRIALHLGDLLF